MFWWVKTEEVHEEYIRQELNQMTHTVYKTYRDAGYTG